MKKNKFFFLAIAILFFCLPIYGQQRSALEKERKQLLKEIDLTKQLLQETSVSKKKSLSQLTTLEKQIELRQEIIINISKELASLNATIKETETVITSLEQDLEELKESYAQLLIYAYKNRSEINELIFIFSSKNFNDAFNRMKYLQRYGEFRKTQAQLIENTKKTLSGKLSDLEKKKNEKQRLLNDQKRQKEKLDNEKSEKDKLIDDLLSQERQLKKDLKKKQSSAEKLNKKIEEIIQREIEIARQKAEAAKKEKKEGSDALRDTPESAKLSADFASNMGKLPWPVQKGIISSRFGKHVHPILKVETFNNGIDIKTNQNAEVRAVFDGEVVSVVYNPGFQRAIIIRHGEYFTVYSNLKDVLLKTGDAVKAKQTIGAVYTDEEENKTEVHLEVWKGTKKLNPALWIYNQ
ncbi:MAG: peptidoglycan DD-metalloendopeptidase family protein [Chitinophagales bacterium]